MAPLARIPGRWLPVALAAASAVLLIGAGGSGGMGAKDDQNVRILRNTHSINYGDNISFELELSSDAAPIVEVQALFKPDGPRVVSSYAYPDFDPGNTVSATFKIPTSGNDFIPPGTILTLSYRIVDSEGSEFNTEPVRVEYLDPKFQWKRRTDGPLTVIYHDRSDGDINRLFAFANVRMPEIAQVYGIEGSRDFRAVLVNSSREADLAFPLTSATARAGHTFIGFAFDEFDEFVMWGIDNRSFVHELAHLMFAQAVSSVLASPPAWLNEGLSVYFESDSGRAGASRLRGQYGPQDLMPIRNMNRVPGQRADIGFFYGKAGSFVEFMIDRFGTAKMAALLGELDRGTRIADAVSATYGFELDDLDAVWTARQFGLPEPELAPAGRENGPAPSEAPLPTVEPTAAPGLFAGPTPFVKILKPNGPTGEVLEDSFWRSWGNWPVIFTGAGFVLAVLFFAGRSLRKRRV